MILKHKRLGFLNKLPVQRRQDRNRAYCLKTMTMTIEQNNNNPRRGIAARAKRTKRVKNTPDCFAINISNKT